MKIKFICFIFLLYTFSACSDFETAAFENPQQGKLRATVKLEEKLIKKFALDSISAPKPVYTEMYTDSSGKRYFTFLNQYAGAIYCYDYETGTFIKKLITGGREQQINPQGYHIKSMDSVYVFNRSNLELVLQNENGQIRNRISLIGNRNIRKDKWMLNYPQYSIQTAIPFIEKNGVLILPGQFPNTISDSLQQKFRFVASVNLNNNQVSYSHQYPEVLYNSRYNWPGQAFTEVFADLHGDGDQLVFSFPVSHELYIAGLHSDRYTKVYAGSNRAGTIHSVQSEKRRVPRTMEAAAFINNDMYGAIKYDPYRKLYYRLLRAAVPGEVVETAVKQKPAVVIILDEHFRYLGETELGTWGEWNLQNFFVTREGLNIEYTGKNPDEEFLILKVFDVKKL